MDVEFFEEGEVFRSPARISGSFQNEVVKTNGDAVGVEESSAKRRLDFGDAKLVKRRKQPSIPVLPVSDPVVRQPQYVIHADLALGLKNVCFVGKILNRYGLFVRNLGANAKKRGLFVDLLDATGYVTVTAYTKNTETSEIFSGQLLLGTWISLTGFAVNRRENWHCGDSPYALELVRGTVIELLEERDVQPQFDTSQTRSFSWFREQPQYTHSNFAVVIFHIKEEQASTILSAATDSLGSEMMDIRVWKTEEKRITDKIRATWDIGVFPVVYFKNLLRGPPHLGASTAPETLLCSVEDTSRRDYLTGVGLHFCETWSLPRPVDVSAEVTDSPIVGWLKVDDYDVKDSSIVCPVCKVGDVDTDGKQNPHCLLCGASSQPIRTGHLDVTLVVTEDNRVLQKRFKLPHELFDVAFGYEPGYFAIAARVDWRRHIHKLKTSNTYGRWHYNSKNWITAYTPIYEDN